MIAIVQQGPGETAETFEDRLNERLESLDAVQSLHVQPGGIFSTPHGLTVVLQVGRVETTMVGLGQPPQQMFVSMTRREVLAAVAAGRVVKPATEGAPILNLRRD